MVPSWASYCHRSYSLCISFCGVSSQYLKEVSPTGPPGPVPGMTEGLTQPHHRSNVVPVGREKGNMIRSPRDLVTCKALNQTLSTKVNSGPLSPRSAYGIVTLPLSICAYVKERRLSPESDLTLPLARRHVDASIRYAQLYDMPTEAGNCYPCQASN